MTKQQTCPECGQAGIPMVIGKPGPSLLAAARAGDVHLAGCLYQGGENRRCPAGHTWADPDHEGRAAEVNAALERRR